jgi:glycosyltransferase involved in cell wall biosynthesis
LEIKTLIIIPCFNEEKRIPIDEFHGFLKSDHSKGISLLFVNDGSTDQTQKILSQLSEESDRIALLELDGNVGKAEAIRSGILRSDITAYQYIGYWDADLASPLIEIPRLIEYTEKSDVQPLLTIGSRIKILGLTKIKRKLRRHYIGRIFATIVSNMLKLPIYDTQCGAKLIHSSVVFELFKDPFLSKWLFDVELIFRLKKVADVKDRILEVPLKSWEDKLGSKIRFSYFLQTPFDLLRIYLNYK